MDCLNNFIGFSQYCGLPESESGYYVCSLPGISTEMADKIANNDQVTFVGVWENVKTVASLKLQTDALAGLADRATLNQVLYQTKLPRRITGTVEAIEEHRGVRLAMPESRFGQVRVKHVVFHSTEEGTGSLKVVNLETEEVVYTQTLSIVTGYNKVPVKYTIAPQYEESTFFIGIDTTTLVLGSFSWDSEYYNFHECYKPCSCNSDLWIFPALEREGIITDTTLNFSVWFDLEFICSIDSFICENKSSLIQPLLYLYGYLLLDFKLKNGLASSRMNFFTNSNIQQTEISRDEYRVEYEKSLKRALKALPLEDSLCFGCPEDSQVTYVATLP